METKTTFHEVDRKQAFGGLIQPADLEPHKKVNDLELYLGDLMGNLHRKWTNSLKLSVLTSSFGGACKRITRLLC